MPIRKKSIKVTTAGAAGSATGSTTSGPINGKLLAIWFDFTGAAATGDTTVAYAVPAMGNIIVISNSATDALHFPRKQASDAAGAAIAGAYDPYPLVGTVTVSVAQSDAGTDSVVATLIYDSEGA